MLRIPTIRQHKAEGILQFISFWSKYYDDQNDKVYKNNINKDIYLKTHIEKLYEWKNGMRLSNRKQLSLETKILPRLQLINELKEEGSIDLKTFLYDFKSVSSVWKIFLLHIIQPNQFPIYDQHIHRAFLFIHGLDYTNISSDTISEKDKWIFYQESYLPFIEKNGITDLKKQDEAFFAFGQFLKTRKYENFFT